MKETYEEKKRHYAWLFPTYGELMDSYIRSRERCGELEDYVDNYSPRIRALEAKNKYLQGEIERLQWELRRERAKQK